MDPRQEPEWGVAYRVTAEDRSSHTFTSQNALTLEEQCGHAEGYEHVAVVSVPYDTK